MKKPNRRIPFIAAAIVIFIPFFYFILVYTQSYELLQSADEYNPSLSTQIYDINGELISELFEENRSYIDIKKIPDHVKHAFIAAEDQNFYKHTGIDVPGILRALMIDIFSGDIRQGGSTITQQLVKQLYTKGEKTARRKIIELVLAYKFEKKYTKDKILEMYLNQIYFGHGVYGINAAARFYFDSSVEDLTIIQAAILAGLPSAPNRYSPLRNPRAAYERCKRVLFSMVLTGYVDRDAVSKDFNQFWSDYALNIRERYHTLGVRSKRFDKAPYFTEYIRRILIKKYGEDKVYRGGLKVYTTLDIRQQKVARKVLKEAIDRQNKVAAYHNRYKLKNIDAVITRVNLRKRNITRAKRAHYAKFLKEIRNTSIDEFLISTMLFEQNYIESLLSKYLSDYEKLHQKSQVEGAIVAVRPQDGAITTMIGGGDFNAANQINRAVQARRQPGSSFKPFVFAAGIEHKLITAAKVFLDAPIVFRGRKKKWSPSNYDKTFFGNVLVRKALAYSLNIVSVLIYETVGGNRIADLASKCIGIPKSRFEIDPTLALGTSELTPLEMAAGFIAFANKGKAVSPYSIRYIVNSNKKEIYNIRWRKNRSRKVMSEETAFIMTSLLREVVDRGTATRAIRIAAGFRKPAAGKTGTNTKFRDAWFVGYTPDLIASVWLGCDSQNFVLGPGQSAAVVAAPTWGKFMNGIYEFTKYTNFSSKIPRNISKIRICSKTGKRPISSCPRRHEYFIKGTEPGEHCDGQHTEMVSVFDLVKKDKVRLMKKMKLFSDQEEDEEEEEEEVEPDIQVKEKTETPKNKIEEKEAPVTID